MANHDAALLHVPKLACSAAACASLGCHPHLDHLLHTGDANRQRRHLPSRRVLGRCPPLPLVECHNVDPARTCVGAPLIVIKECIELRKTEMRD